MKLLPITVRVSILLGCFFIYNGAYAEDLTKTEQQTALIFKSQLARLARDLEREKNLKPENRPKKLVSESAVLKRSMVSMIKELNRLGEKDPSTKLQEEANKWQETISKLLPLPTLEQNQPGKAKEEQPIDLVGLQKLLKDQQQKFMAIVEKVRTHGKKIRDGKVVTQPFSKNDLKKIDELGKYENEAIDIIKTWFALLPEFTPVAVEPLVGIINEAWEKALFDHEQTVYHGLLGGPKDISSLAKRFADRVGACVAVERDARQEKEQQQEQAEKPGEELQEKEEEQEQPAQPQQEQNQGQNLENQEPLPQQGQQPQNNQPQGNQPYNWQPQGQGQFMPSLPPLPPVPNQPSNVPPKENVPSQPEPRVENKPVVQPPVQPKKKTVKEYKQEVKTHIDLLDKKENWDIENQFVSTQWFDTFKQLYTQAIEAGVKKDEIIKPLRTGVYQNVGFVYDFDKVTRDDATGEVMTKIEAALPRVEFKTPAQLLQESERKLLESFGDKAVPFVTLMAMIKQKPKALSDGEIKQYENNAIVAVRNWLSLADQNNKQEIIDFVKKQYKEAIDVGNKIGWMQSLFGSGNDKWIQQFNNRVNNIAEDKEVVEQPVKELQALPFDTFKPSFLAHVKALDQAENWDKNKKNVSDAWKNQFVQYYKTNPLVTEDELKEAFNKDYELGNIAAGNRQDVFDALKKEIMP